MTQELALTSLQDWLSGEETITLSTGHTVKVRTNVDILSLMDDGNGIPNIFLPILEKHMGLKPKPQPQKERTAEEAKAELDDYIRIMNRVTEALLVYPPLVQTEEEVREGKGLTVHHIPFEAKISIMSYAMGGKKALEASSAFLKQPNGNVVALQTGKRVSGTAKRNRRVTG